MAGGANKRFIAEKEQFLKANLIEVAVSDNELINVAQGNVNASKALAMNTGRIANQGQAIVTPTHVKAAGVYDFDLIKDAHKAEIDLNGRRTQIPIYKLKAWGTKDRDRKIVAPGVVQYKKPTYAHTLSAFWLPWSSGSSWSVQLGPQADYFFTATMDGCSLAISSGPTPIVTHSNYKSTQNPNVASEGLTRYRIQQQHQAHGADVQRSLMKSQYVASPNQKTRGINYMVTVIGFRNSVSNTLVVLLAAAQGDPRRRHTRHAHPNPDDGQAGADRLTNAYPDAAKGQRPDASSPPTNTPRATGFPQSIARCAY
jgi:hypothetical protein